MSHPQPLPHRWPGPSAPAGRTVLVAAAAVGVVTAACVPLDRPGIGWIGAGLAAAGGVAVITRTRNVRRIAWTALALALLAVGAIRAAGWLFALCVPTAGMAAAMALTRGSSVRGMAAGMASVLAAIARAIPWAVRGIVPPRAPAPAASPATTPSASPAPATLAAAPAPDADWAARPATGASPATTPSAGPPPPADPAPAARTAAPAPDADWARPATGATPATAPADGPPLPADPAPPPLPATWAIVPAPPRSTPVPVRALAVGAVSIGLLWVFGALFASADPAFADLLTRLTIRVDIDEVPQHLFLFVAGTLGLLGAAYLVTAPPDLSGLEAPAPRRVRPWEWAVPVAALDLLFAAFVLVQLTVLFGGARHVLGADGPTYAEYARSGFWQLLTVTVLTVPVVGLAARKAPSTDRSDRILIRVLLGALAGLTLVIVASALYRMNLYEQAYGFTRLRILVSACELWLGAVFVMVLAAGVRLRARWLAQAVAASGAAALLGLALLNPDRFIAERNIDRYERIDRIDVQYLSRLSADAAPAMDRLPYPLRDCALSTIAADLAESPDDWRGANLGRARARDVLADQAPRTNLADCLPR